MGGVEKAERFLRIVSVFDREIDRILNALESDKVVIENKLAEVSLTKEVQSVRDQSVAITLNRWLGNLQDLRKEARQAQEDTRGACRKGAIG